jgi:hypothetical protein
MPTKILTINLSILITVHHLREFGILFISPTLPLNNQSRQLFTLEIRKTSKNKQ